MSKTLNRKGKFSHSTRKDKDFTKHWKYGKSSGDPEASKRRRERKGKKRLNQNKGKKWTKK